MQPRPITHPHLDAGPLAHGFFTRRGGVSKGIHGGLNCGYGSDDAQDSVAQNRARVADALAVAPDDLITLHQFHSADVVLAQQSWSPDTAPRGDAMVCTTSGIALGILTADCAPVLFADTRGGVIGAAHAGWRGALTGVWRRPCRSWRTGAPGGTGSPPWSGPVSPRPLMKWAWNF